MDYLQIFIISLIGITLLSIIFQGRKMNEEKDYWTMSFYIGAIGAFIAVFIASYYFKIQ